MGRRGPHRDLHVNSDNDPDRDLAKHSETVDLGEDTLLAECRRSDALFNRLIFCILVALLVCWLFSILYRLL